MYKSIIALLTAIFLLSPVSARAIHFQNGDSVTLPQDKTFNESVFVAANTLTINSPINGDLYCAGRDVVINAPIAGDVICAAETIKVSGKFTGNLRLAGRTIDTDAEVHSSATLAGETVTVRPTASYGGDLIVGASSADLSGKTSRDLAVGSKQLTYSGQLLRNAQIYGQNITFSDTAKVGGTLDLFTPADSQVNLPATAIMGQVNRHQIQAPAEAPATKPTVVSWLTGRLWSILSFLLVGLMLLNFARIKTLTSANIAATRPIAAFFSGFGILILTPIAFLIIFITIVGIPAAFLILFLYIIGLIIASVITAILVGHLILSNYAKDEKFQTPYYYLLLGLPLLWLAFAIPQLGWLIAFVSLCLGLGAYFLSFLPEKQVAKTTE